MAHITTGVEYGLHCLFYLVDPLEEKQSASVRDLAELQGVPVEYVAKLFTKLKKAGLVLASEGVGGGFRLARPAELITVLEIIEAIEGEKPLFECQEIRGRCAVFNGRPPTWATRGTCSIHAIMLEAEARMREVLASYSLADIARSLACKAPANYSRELAKWLNG
jgi:Rrf2 family protein